MRLVLQNYLLSDLIIQFYNQILIKKNQPYKLNISSSSTNFDIGISQKFSRKTRVDIFIDNYQKKSFEINKKNLNVNISNLVLEKEASSKKKKLCSFSN